MNTNARLEEPRKRRFDEILAWEQRKEMERDNKFVELGRYLCEVRPGQPTGVWRR